MKTKFPRAAALAVAKEICQALAGSCERLIVAGSLRRGAVEAGDVEIVYISRREIRPVTGDMFAKGEVDCAACVISGLEKAGVLERRENLLGSTMYGPKNKLMRHAASGIPVDLFATREEAWWNYLVCRTGPAELNTRIASLAQDRGWRWNPYAAGFTHTERGEVAAMDSEEAVFAFVGLPYLAPRERR